MIRSKVFLKYLVGGTVFLLIFFTLSLFVNYQLNKQGFHQLPDQMPLKRIAKRLQNLTSTSRVEFLEEAFFSPAKQNRRRLELYLVNNNKQILYPYSRDIKILDVRLDQSLGFFSFVFPVKNRYLVEQLTGDPSEYLVIKAKSNRYQKQIKRRRKKFLMIHGVLLFSMIVVFLSSTLFIFYSLKSRVKHIDRVIEDLSNGKLQSRLPIERLDEIGFMMARFNSMFDKIEGLVISLRKSEAVRKNLLSELAHDLRTPIASLKNFLEMLMEKRDRISKEKQNEMFSMAISEIDYFSHIVDDLLFIGLIEEPKYQQNKNSIDLIETITNELSLLQNRYSAVESKKYFKASSYFVDADDRLIKRLIRNLLENSLSFAKSEIIISLSEENNMLKLLIEDDGRGFSEEAIESYGKRKFSRQIEESHNRISIGLGSVIIKTIVEAYGGSIVVSNIIGDNSKIVGARILIHIKQTISK